jgi:GDP-4-dehydro-6-deoxy-D-mannose reductase
VGNLNGYRDLLPVTRVARYLKVLSEKGEPGSIYNVCSGRPQKIGNILKVLLSLSKCKINISLNRQRIRKNDINWSVGDNSKILKLDRVPISSQELEQSIKETLDYCRENT